MKTEISTDRNAAVELLRNGQVVALPTETVYGLAADALNPIAHQNFRSKGTPAFRPAHCSSSGARLVGKNCRPSSARHSESVRRRTRSTTDFAARQKILARTVDDDFTQAQHCSGDRDGGSGHSRSSNQCASSLRRNHSRIRKTARCAQRQSLRSNQSDNGGARPGRTRRAHFARHRCRPNHARN